MEFLNPVALYGLLALPLLLVAYLIRRKPRRVRFSSLLLFAELGARPGGAPWGRLRLPPIFFLQLFLLALLMVALAEPVFSVRPSRIAIVVDNSASMQVRENGRTRFDLARDKARSLLADLGPAGKVDLYHTVPNLEKMNSTALTPADAAGVLSRTEPYDLGDLPIDYNTVLGQMAHEQRYDRVYLVTDHPGHNREGSPRVISVGQPAGNLALTSFQINRISLTSTRLQAAVKVANFSSKDAKVKVVLRGAGTALSVRDLMIPAGKTETANFDGLPPHAYYEAEIDGRDALTLDNRRFALAPKSQNLRVLGITPRPQSLASLRSIAGVSVDIIAPRDYERTDRSGYNLEVFHFASPSVLPAHSALFVLPPDNLSLVNLEQPISGTIVSSWREPHVLTRYVNFALFRLSYARPLQPQTPGEVILASPRGPLAFAVERHGFRDLVLGFDPFPYLGRDNLPMSIFTLNFLDWFLRSAGGNEKTTGDALGLGTATQGDWIVNPRGEKLSLNPGTSRFAESFYQGIYQLNRAGDKELFAVNLGDPGESDLREPSPIEIRNVEGKEKSGSALFSFWPYLLLAALFLLLVEWFLHPRGTSSAGFRPVLNRNQTRL